MWSIRKRNIGIPLDRNLENVFAIGFDGATPIELTPQLPRNPKWVTLHNDALSLMQLNENDIDFLKGKKDESEVQEFIPGQIYYIERDAIEGVEFGRIYFLVYGIVKNYKGVNLNSLVVREVGLDENGKFVEDINITGRRKFSISPSMCKLFGIEYRPGFELWPMTSGFKKVDIDEILDEELNYGDMSTYPTSSVDGTIRTILLELHGFSPYNSSHIITPTGAMIPTEEFTSSLTIFARQNIGTDNGCAGFMKDETLPFRIVTREGTFSICDENHNIYVEVLVTKPSHNVNTKDQKIGISKTALDGKDIDDIIGVKWDESGDVNNKKKETPKKVVTDIDVDKVFQALDRHFSRMDYLFSKTF